MEKIEQVLEELHDFRVAGGACASDWVLQVCLVSSCPAACWCLLLAVFLFTPTLGWLPNARTHAQVTVKEHDGKDDEEGERVNAARVEAAPGYRLYAPVTPDHLIRVTLKNLSAQPLSFVPVYVGKDGTKEEEDKVDLASGEVRVGVGNSRRHGGRVGSGVWCEVLRSFWHVCSLFAGAHVVGAT